MSESDQIDPLLELVSCFVVVGRNHALAEERAIELMDEGGCLTDAAVANCLGWSTNIGEGVSALGMCEAGLWEPVKGLPGKSYRVVHWTLSRKYQPTGPSVVYFVQAGGPKGPVKIGRTNNPGVRVATLQTGNAEPLRILATVPGGQFMEAALHGYFAPWRINGEWFMWDLPLEALVLELAGKH